MTLQLWIFQLSLFEVLMSTQDCRGLFESRPSELSGLSLRDFSGPHFSKPEPELGEKQIVNPEN